jgi:hypothetical protein
MNGLSFIIKILTGGRNGSILCKMQDKERNKESSADYNEEW